MKGVLRIKAFHELSLVITIDKQAKISVESHQLSWKAPGLASQAFQIMTQVSIDSFHRIGFLFVRAHLIRCTIVESVISRKRITVILFRLRSPFQASLQVGTGPFTDRIPAQNAVGGSIYYRENIDFVFLCFRNVYNSSSSAMRGLAGTCAGGSCST